MPNPKLLLPLADPDDILEAKNTISALKYQLKKVENGSKSKRAETQLLLKKQGEIIENLEKEKSEVRQSVHLLQSESLTIGDQKCSNQLKRLLKIQDRYRLEIDAAKQALKMLNKQLFSAHKSLLHIQREIDFSNDNYKVIKHQKKIELLESRLNNAIVKFDHFHRRNSIFREQIDVMLNVRSVFYQNYTNIKQMIMQTKQSAKEIIHSSSMSYKTREEMKYRIGVLEERTRFDRKRVSDEVKALKRVLEHDKQLCSFLRHRDKERKSEARERFKKNPLKVIDLLKEEVQLCSNIFKEISAVASTKDIATMIAKFQKVEDDNFTKFGIINEMNNEIENLRNSIQILQINIRNEENKLTFHQKKAAYVKGNVKDMLKMLENDVENLQRSASENSTILENTKDFIRKLFEKTNKFYTAEPELFDNDDVINVDAQQFIEILEIRIMELLYCYQYLLYKLRKDEGDDILLSEITAAPATHPHSAEDDIIPPQIEDFIVNIEEAHDIQKQIYNEEKLAGLANTSILRRLGEE